MGEAQATTRPAAPASPASNETSSSKSAGKGKAREIFIVDDDDEDDEGDDGDVLFQAISRLESTIGPAIKPAVVSARAKVTRQCLICMDDIQRGKGVRMACKDRHWWDYDCLRTFVLAAMKDASVMPPKCEGFDIPEDSFLFLLTADERREYHTKHAEFIDKDPVFCTKTSCSLYLGTRRKRKTAITCLTCNERTCGACKAAWHGRDAGCTAPADNDVISKLRKGGIQRCPECRRMVERAAGCNKIWCICRALFCYECGASWKTCNCPYFPGEQPLPAQGIVRIPGLNAPAPVPMPAPVLPNLAGARERVARLGNMPTAPPPAPRSRPRHQTMPPPPPALVGPYNDPKLVPAILPPARLHPTTKKKSLVVDLTDNGSGPSKPQTRASDVSLIGMGQKAVDAADKVAAAQASSSNVTIDLTVDPSPPGKKRRTIKGQQTNPTDIARRQKP